MCWWLRLCSSDSADSSGIHYSLKVLCRCSLWPHLLMTAICLWDSKASAVLLNICYVSYCFFSCNPLWLPLFDTNLTTLVLYRTWELEGSMQHGSCSPYCITVRWTAKIFLFWVFSCGVCMFSLCICVGASVIWNWLLKWIKCACAWLLSLWWTGKLSRAYLTAHPMDAGICSILCNLEQDKAELLKQCPNISEPDCMPDIPCFMLTFSKVPTYWCSVTSDSLTERHSNWELCVHREGGADRGPNHCEAFQRESWFFQNSKILCFTCIISAVI